MSEFFINLDGNDFGFSAFSDEHLMQAEQEATELAHTKSEEAEYYKLKLHEMHGMIMPLLTNLLKDADKPNIHWPNRKQKLEEFIDNINTILEDD